MGLCTPRPAMRAAFLAALLIPAACTDRNPTDVAPEPPAASAAVLRCTVDVRAATLACRPEGAETPAGISPVILGGQGTNVRLASSGTAYNSATGVLRSDVTVENLTAQALGTEDGTTPAADGVRVFFHSGPTVTGGSGSVSVFNADGVATFTSSGQPYIQYDGILAPGDTTPAKEWLFELSGTVATFAFTVYVAAPVPREAGSVALSPVAPSLMVGGTLAMAATVRGVTGAALPGEPVAWTSSVPGVATVSASGLVTAVSVGTTTITATSGARTGSVSLVVTSTSSNAAAPEVVSFSLSPVAVEAGGADSVTMEARLRDAGPGISAARFTLLTPAGDFRRTCTANAAGRVSGTAFDGVYRCRMAFPAGSWDGVWTVESVEALGLLARRRVVSTAALLAAGAPARLYVESASADSTAPSIDNFTLRTPVTVGVDSIGFTITASDAGVGIEQAGVYVRQWWGGQEGAKGITCAFPSPTSGTRNNAVFRCAGPAPASLAGGEWVVDSVWARDRNGNHRVMMTDQLDSAGFATEMHVTPDTVPPVITAFSYSPATVAGNGVDSVTVTLSASDALSGVVLMQARFQPVGNAGQWKDCYSGTVSARPSHSITCKLTFSAAEVGNWEVTSVWANDFLGNTKYLGTAQLQAAGYSTQLTVTP
jgi:hypothetical protein